MSDNQPQHQNPYDPYTDPYTHPSPDHHPTAAAPLHGDTPGYAPPSPHPGYDPQTAYGTPYGQQPYDPYMQQQPQHQQTQPAPQHQQPQQAQHAQQPYGYDAYGQPQHQSAAPYGQDGYGPDAYGDDAYGSDAYAAPVPAAAQHHGAHQGAHGAAHGTTATAEPVPAGHPEAEAAAPAAPAPAAPLKPNQIARAEGRSPIIPPGIQPAALTALLALLLALAAPVARPVLVVPVVLLQAVTAAGWFRLNGMWPARQGIALAFLGGVATDVGLLATPHEDAPLVAIGTLGVWCLLVIVLQLRNRSSADERMYALTAGLTSSALAVLASGHLAADPDAVVVGAAAVALATLARALPLPGPLTLVLGLLAGAGGGIAAGQLTGMGATAALLGLAAGGCALIGLRVASYDYPSKFVHMTAGVALPLALAAPAVYVLGRALG
ncbi:MULTISPECIES: hypothetical protein [Streptomyces]|uniref:Peptidase C83 domain-containing protein n=2 Tax=Streptomyces TaxID=1883 RepID=A0A2N8P4S8_STRNR|nr:MULTISPECIES: hypothetical protein [Streptomyces]PNE36028.1 hypothetical protein AOB60_38380 [Streptomyces noursei]SHN15097.1 hypothetical protein SAMN05216268_121117 [Streptomyces yunnanensis]